MNIKRVFTNATFSVIQTIVSGITLFILYKFVIVKLGTEQLGLWSVILASTSVVRLSDLGITGSVVKFVAKYQAINQPENASSIIQTAVISIAAVMAVICLAIYPFLDTILSFAIPAESMDQALVILPWAILTLWLASIGGVFQSALDGCHRMDIKNAVLMFANIAFLASAFWLVPAYGLKGLALAQAAQAGLVLLLCWYFLRKNVELPIIPMAWSLAKFKEMFSYSLNFQINSIAILLFDPVVKLLMSKYAGLSSAAFYEMANQLVTKLRAVIISANQAFVPAVAELHELNPTKVRELYIKAFGFVAFISIPFFSLIALSLPLLSKVWIGHVEMQFVLFGALLSLGWAVNTLSGPAYFFNLGTGRLKWNTVAHVSMAALNVILGFTFGVQFGGVGVAIAAMIAVITSSALLIGMWHWENSVLLSESPNDYHARVFLGSLAGLASGGIIYSIDSISDHVIIKAISAMAILVALVFSASFRSPFFAMIRSRLSGAK